MPSVVLSITEDQIFDTLGAVLNIFGLKTNIPGSVLVIKGQTNRVPPPPGTDYVAMWTLMRGRLAMNIDTYFDNQFTGSITENVLTVEVVNVGAVAGGQTLYGTNVPAGCEVATQLTGPPGGPGTYAVTLPATTTPATIYSGIKSVMQETKFSAQVDVHGPSSGDNAQRISSLLWDQVGVDAFAALPGGLWPLYCDDPRQTAFVNDAQQYEDRYTIDVHLQVNIAALVTQQFADKLAATTQAFA